MISRLKNTKFNCAMARAMTQVILNNQLIEDHVITLVEAFLVTV